MTSATSPHSVKEVMIHPVTTIAPEMKLWEVAELFLKKGFSGAPVVDNMQRVISVIGEGLILRLAASEGLDATIAHCLPKMPKGSEVLLVKPDDSIASAYKLILKHNVHRLPVVDDNGKLLGLISRTTILRIFIEAHYGKAITSKP